ncbi:hypothetical protein LZV00_11205 [Pseudomonas kielensis]|uniref:hypothetical protein n=1 Tax=Pseudomonas kielensis TaxID=2762577 RepID=UPI00223FAD89|nr:hypothetical protein [Pseudomonas kielensis]UZM16233.1 hypothetical protein LZV00_11205 [Pseudomonas kielensis]
MLNLNQIFDGATFALDNRSIDETLQNFKDYVALIPFDNTHHWDQVFFPNEDDIRLLAARYRSPELGDGKLAPQQAFLLAFLHQLETPKALFNSLPARHRQLYYRDLLGLAPRGAQPDQVAVSFELSPGAAQQLLPADTALDAGQDSQGQPLRYRLDAPLQINAGQLSDVRWVRPVKAGALCHIVQSGEEQPFPANGVRLFAAQAQEQAVTTGLVVADEVLALTNGRRTLTVTFASAPDAGEILAAVSTEHGWLNLQPDTLDGLTTNAVFTLTVDQPAITPPSGLDGFDDAVPLLKLSRADGGEVPAVKTIKVDTTQPTDITFSTQDGVAQPDQDCLPFGAEPLQGACVRLMAPDWCRKSQTITVTLTPVWEGLPDDQSFNRWYTGYTGSPTNDNAFTVTAETLTAKSWTTLAADLPLFEDNTEATTAPVGRSLTFSFSNLPSDVSDSADPADWSSHLRLMLGAQTFLHQEYWQTISSGEAADLATSLKPPYTPQWASLAITYTSTQPIDAAAQYRLTPFGHQAAGDVADASTQPQLYLGFGAMQPGQQLSLYWKLQSPQPLSIDWQYLNQANQWTSLNAEVLDGTGGLFASGLWSATLPADASDQATQMPLDHHWLRGVMTPTAPSDDDMVSDYPQLQGLLANAMTATLADVDTVAVDHFEQPLSAGSMTQTVDPIADLAGVSQPWPSQNGRAPEAQLRFNTRVARQLSHRGRALRRNDLQTLLLEQFPEVYAVHLPEGISTPGQQTLTVIPAPGVQDNDDAKRPVFNPARLTRMQQAMQQRTSPWATLTVDNPRYIDVAVAFDVEFVPEVSPDYGTAQLIQVLERRYLPWAFDDKATIEVGNPLDYYQLLAFIQQQPYVTRVQGLALNGAQDSISAEPGQVLTPAFGQAKGQLATPGNVTLAGTQEKQLTLRWNAVTGATHYQCHVNGHLFVETEESSGVMSLAYAWQYPEGTKFSVRALKRSSESSDLTDAYLPSENAVVTLSQTNLRDMNTPLKPDDVASGDDYGRGLAVDAAGNLVAAGAPNQAAGLGAVYLFQRTADGWVQKQKLVGEVAGGHFGAKVGLSEDGKRLVVAACNTPQGGHVYVFDWDNAANVYRRTKAWSSPAAGAADLFGTDLALSGAGKRLAVGAPGEASGVGAVYVLDEIKGEWSTPLKIDTAEVSPVLENHSAFGRVLSLSADGQALAITRQLIGVEEEKEGRVELFRYSDAWQKEFSFYRTDVFKNSYGKSISLDGAGTRCLIGTCAPYNIGRIALAEKIDNTWIDTGMYSNIGLGYQGDGFGSDVKLSFSGDIAVTQSIHNIVYDGGVQVFTRNTDGELKGTAHLGCYFSTQQVALNKDGMTLVAMDEGDNNFGVYLY